MCVLVKVVQYQCCYIDNINVCNIIIDNLKTKTYNFEAKLPFLMTLMLLRTDSIL